jgi:hypothetical protein
MLTRNRYHRLLLQIGAARSDELICSRCSRESRESRGLEGCVRFPSQPRKGTSKRPETIAFAITAAKTNDGQRGS